MINCFAVQSTGERSSRDGLHLLLNCKKEENQLAKKVEMVYNLIV